MNTTQNPDPRSADDADRADGPDDVATGANPIEALDPNQENEPSMSETRDSQKAKDLEEEVYGDDENPSPPFPG